MEWNVLLVSHVVAALFALLIGPINLLRRRRDRTHRLLGYTWAASMYYVCISSFWIRGEGHLSWLHGLSALTMVTVSLGILGAVQGNRVAHSMNMIGSYLGLLIAFFFAAAVPSRHIPQLLADSPSTAWLTAAFVALSVSALYLTVRPRPRTAPGRSISRLTPGASLSTSHRDVCGSEQPDGVPVAVDIHPQGGRFPR